MPLHSSCSVLHAAKLFQKLDPPDTAVVSTFQPIWPVVVGAAGWRCRTGSGISISQVAYKATGVGVERILSFSELPPYLRGATVKYPIELTLLSLFLRAAKADDCGNNIRIPYMHLYRYGYFSGSSSCSLKSDVGVSKLIGWSGHGVSYGCSHVKTGDSMSCTSLSTWIRRFTVMSNSPLPPC